MKRNHRQPDPEGRIIRLALFIFLLIILGTITCEKGKDFCQKAEEFVQAVHHLSKVITNPDEAKEFSAPSAPRNPKDTEEQTRAATKH